MDKSIVYQEWVKVKRQGKWVEIWLQMIEGILESNLVLSAHCQDGLLEAKERDTKRLNEVKNELDSGLAQKAEEGKTELERHTAKDRLRNLGAELRLLRGRLADVEFKLKSWRVIPLGGCETVSAMKDPMGEKFEILQPGSSKMLELKAKSSKARDELLASVTEVGLRRGMSQLTMCATSGFTVDESMSLRRNQRQDPREKLSMTAAEDDKKLLEMLVQPPEMWPTPPRPSYGSVKWQERLNQEREAAEAAAGSVAVSDENVGEQTTYFETVHWHDRALESVPDSLWGIPSYAKLKHLYLENNNVKELPIQLSNFEFLEVFSFSKNDIGALPGWIGKLSELKIISLAHNRVPEIPKEIGDLCKLDTLNLYSNKIETIPLTLAHCTAITSLNLAANPWQVWVKSEVAVEEATEGDSDDDEEVFGKNEVDIEDFQEPDTLGLSEELVGWIKSGKVAEATRQVFAYIQSRMDGFDEERRLIEERRATQEERERKALFASEAFQAKKAELKQQQEALERMARQGM